MADFRSAPKLTHSGALRLLHAAIKAANDMNVPQCISIVDEGCNLLAFVRMDGARVLSVQSATRKAMTAATTGQATGHMDPAKAAALAAATDGKMINLLGGLPLIVAGQLVGGIGVGSGTSEQDLDVAQTAVAAFDASQTGDLT